MMGYVRVRVCEERLSEWLREGCQCVRPVEPLINARVLSACMVHDVQGGVEALEMVVAADNVGENGDPFKAIPLVNLVYQKGRCACDSKRS